jgi:hypothetical protein
MVTSILACAGILAYGLAAQEQSAAAVSVGLLGLAWLLTLARGLNRVHGYAFVLFVLLATVTMWVNIPAWLVFTSVTFSLAAWDLAVFDQRLQMTADSSDQRNMERAHLRRLALVLGLAALGYAITTRVHLDLTFGAATLLILLIIWGISALVYRLRSYE